MVPASPGATLDALLEPWTLGLAERRAGIAPDALATVWTSFAAATAATRAFHAEWDVLLSPVTRHLPLPIGALAPTRPFDALWDAFFDQASFTPVQNITGQPSISLPLGWTDAGLPIGVMLSAAVGGDDLLLALSAEIESARPWADRRPPGFAARLAAGLTATAIPA